MAHDGLQRGHDDAGAAEPLHGGWRRHLDLAGACVLAGLAAFAFLVLPAGSVVRFLLVLGVLFLVPGYLLIELAAGPARSRGRSAVRALLAIGVSPPVVAVLALATAIVPHGFKAGPIVATITIACYILAGLALWRRLASSATDLPLAAAVA